MAGGYDGSIKIDTQIDERGLVDGFKRIVRSVDGSMKDLLKSTGAAAEGTAMTFEEAWAGMTFEQMQPILIETEKRLSNIGQSFSNMSREAQQASLKETFESMNRSADQAAETVDKKAAPAMKKMSIYGHGFSRILGAMVPGMFRIRRAAVGFAEVGSALKSANASGLSIAKTLGVVAAVAVGAVLVGVVMFRSFIRWAQRLTDTLVKNLSTTSAMRDRVLQLKGAYDTLRGTIIAMGASLLNALAPVLLKIINWLVRAINWISMFIAALTKQKTVIQYIAGSVDGIADSTGQMAKNTQKAEKAAKGALAAFDEINVLQLDTADATDDIAADLPTGGAGAGGNIEMKEVPVPDDFIKTSWDNLVIGIKTQWNDFVDWYDAHVVQPIRSKIEDWLGVDIWGEDGAIDLDNLIVGLKTKWSEFVDWYDEKIISPVREALASIPEWGKEQWTKFDTWFRNITQPWADWIRTRVTEPINQWFENMGEKIRLAFANAWAKVKLAWSTAWTWFYNTVIAPIRKAFDTALNAIKTKWETVFNRLRSFVRNVINGIISLINGMLNAIGTGINGIIRALNKIKIDIPKTPFSEAFSVGINLPQVTMPQIPKLAGGAVIPPNAQFAAILGDQRSGTNIETPVGLMEETFSKVLADALADQNINVRFTGTMSELIRALKPEIDRENSRVGESLIKGSLA